MTVIQCNVRVYMNQIKKFSNYSITQDGNVWSSKRNIWLKQYIQSKGYLWVALYCGLKRSNRTVHRLVAEAFIPNPDNKPEVNHKDGIKTNNNVSNLEWSTSSENKLHKHHVLMKQNGEQHPHHKLTESEVQYIRTSYIPKITTFQMLADELNVDRSVVHRIYHNKSWKHV